MKKKEQIMMEKIRQESIKVIEKKIKERFEELEVAVEMKIKPEEKRILL